MARQPYVKYNNSWAPVKHIWVDNEGTWTQAKAAWKNVNGAWQQIWPPDPITAKLLIVAGGGAGGSISGYEGGGGGGAGGVIYNASYTLSAVNTTYQITVGAGGGTNQNGEDSYFGINGQPITIPGPNVPLYPGTYPVYNSFLNTYGVWFEPSFSSSGGSVTYTAYIPKTGQYRVVASADNSIGVSIDGVGVVSNSDWGGYNEATINLSAGNHSIQCGASNWGGPAMFAAAIYDNRNNVIWNSRQISPIVVVPKNGLNAVGGGAGGRAPIENGPGRSGGSGGGGSGYVQNAPGGSPVVGQGNWGGDGAWQGTGQAGGGGGGGYRSMGSPSNVNWGGNGGDGASFNIGGLIFNVGGGGGGGYGNQSPDGFGPGGRGGFGGGGDGGWSDSAGRNSYAGGSGIGIIGEANTGGGGGGCGHGALLGGDGGSGIVVVSYISPFGQPLFTGGDSVSISDNGDNTATIVHTFTTVGTHTLVGAST